MLLGRKRGPNLIQRQIKASMGPTTSNLIEHFCPAHCCNTDLN